MRHQRRDDYWKPGSVCEDFSRIKAAVYAVSGWGDSYSRNVLALLEGLSSPKKALIGPWSHGWPHLARPGPAIGFMQEALRWWDHWLKGIDTGIMDEPMLRVWMQDWIAPAKSVEHWPGRWVAQTRWRPERAQPQILALTREGLREALPVQALGLSLCSPQNLGLSAGYQCSYGLGPDLSDDQSADDALSLCFDGEPLPARMEILGEAVLELELSSDKPQALLAARLCDVAPDGSSLRLGYGLLNLSHRDGSAEPVPLLPGQNYTLRLPLCAMAHALAPGHRLRLALSTGYWPIAWPSPEAVTLKVSSGRLLLPVRTPNPALDDVLPAFGEPEGAAPHALVETRPRSPARLLDRIEQGSETGRVDLVRERDRGAWRTSDTDVAYDTRGELRFSIDPADPLSARQSIELSTDMGRPGWQVRTEVSTTLSCTKDSFVIQTQLQAFEGVEPVFSGAWTSSIRRDNM